MGRPWGLAFLSLRQPSEIRNAYKIADISLVSSPHPGINSTTFASKLHPSRRAKIMLSSLLHTKTEQAMANRRKQALRPQHADTDDFNVPLWWFIFPLLLGCMIGTRINVLGM